MKPVSLALTFLFAHMLSFGRDIIYLQNDSRPKNEREAIVILAGLGSLKYNARKIAKHFRNHGYDIYQPTYIYRKSIQKGIDKIDRFSKQHDLKKYKKVHFFCYIIGAWTFNGWYNQSELTNVETIVYDRSPLQERAPYALVKDNKFLIELLVGKVITELSETPYIPLNGFHGKMGLLIETKPTKLILKHKKTAASLGLIDWNLSALNQDYTDHCFMPVDHDDMYKHIEKVSNEVWSLIKTGTFTVNADRTIPSHQPLNS